jgi:RNA polymerase sigma-70 factor, ECF subfamily
LKRRDPLANPAPLIERVYAYAAYRLGAGPDAEDVTSDVFERALRYRHAYDESRGAPAQWLLGIARRCVDDALRSRADRLVGLPIREDGADFDADAMRRLDLTAAIERLDARSQDLLALRFGADLSARRIGEILDLKTNAVEVALHRALGRLRAELEHRPGGAQSTFAGSKPEITKS